jgi:hypothetical protein
MTLDHLRCGKGTRSPSARVLASNLVFEDGLARLAEVQTILRTASASAATLGIYSRDDCGYDLITQYRGPYTSDAAAAAA